MDNPEAGATPGQAAGGGPPAGYPAYPPYPAHRPTNGLAIAALVTGGISFISCPLLGAVAVYLGNRARNEIRHSGENGDSLAFAGLILGWCALALGVLVLLLWALLMAAFIAINAGHGAG